MPYTIRRSRKSKKCYQVVNTKTRRVFSKCSNKSNAKKQMRLLRAIQYNKNFVMRPRPSSS
jgi:hypothetical protein